MTFAIVVFPGSNCDRDCAHVVADVCGQSFRFVRHTESILPTADIVILPGGFSYGDYLRAGAIARRSPIMAEVAEFARKGGLLLGICNGFQILTEAGLLPGAFLRNASLRFECRDVTLRVENVSTPFTCAWSGNKGKLAPIVRMPIAHMDGNYYVDGGTLQTLESERRIVFRYCDADGLTGRTANPNGSIANIAGVCNEAGNVLGLMPHPERCAEALLGGTDGRCIFESIEQWKQRKGKNDCA
ncbi:MAG: phosphoribosylformylglycinamidine synthase subunit PurQ [Deltaproteobacteria bacterium]|nr:phosphoribosylformylglycinamidine synthase subunit PurQ [Deltaproteobacteria bacterium]